MGENPDGKEKATDVFSRWMAALAGLFGVAGTVVGIWSQIEVQHQQTQANALKREIDVLKEEREDRRLNYDISIKIYDKITELDQSDPDELRLAGALVEVLPDGHFKIQMAQALAQLSSSIAQSAESGLVGMSQEETEAQKRLATVASAVAQAANDVINRPPRSVTVQAGIDSGWDYDVFWCDGPDGSRYYELAHAVAERSKTLTNGRIRVRVLSELTNQRAGYGIQGNVVRVDQNDAEKQEAEKVLASLNRTADRFGGVFQAQASGSGTRWYLSLFVCPL